MITIKNLKKIYNSSSIRTVALDNITISIKEKEFISIVGKSGCGKSTLLNIIGGIDSATSGSYKFENMSINSLTGRQLTEFRNKTIGYIFQSFNLINELNIIDNVAMPLGFANVSKKKRNMKSIEFLKKVGLEEHLHKKPTQLSGGQKQRVAIARALINNPKVVLADEPTGNLDENTGTIIIELLKEIHKNGTTVILVTHDMNLAQVSQRIIHMKDGNIIFEKNT